MPPASDRRDDGERVPVLNRSRIILEVTDVVVVEVNIHEGAQFALVVVKVLAKVGIGGRKAAQSLADCGRWHFDGGLLAGILTQWGGNQYFHCSTSDASR